MHYQKGMSLVELMIAALISLLVIQGTLQLFLSNVASAKHHETRSLAQERAQQALRIITGDVRMAASGAGTMGPGSYNIFYDQTLTGATHNIVDRTLERCQKICDAMQVKTCTGFSWANGYVVENMQADFTNNIDLSCIARQVEAANQDISGSAQRIAEVLTVFRNAVNVLLNEIQEVLRHAEMGTTMHGGRGVIGPEQEFEGDIINGEIGISENQLNALRNQVAGYNSFITTANSYINNLSNSPSASLVTAVINWLRGERETLQRWGINTASLDNLTVGGSMNRADSCLDMSAPDPLAKPGTTGTCRLELTGLSYRKKAPGWISYQHSNNTIFYTDTCSGATCTQEGSGTASDAIAVVFDPVNDQDCTGNTVSTTPTSDAHTLGAHHTVNRYFIASNGQGGNGLFCQGFNPINSSARGSAHMLVDGVDSLQVLYGYADTGGLQPTSYRAANDVTNWGYVRNVQIGVLVNGGMQPSQGGSTTRDYNVMNNGQLSFTDRTPRYVFTTLQSLAISTENTSWRDRVIYEPE